jgi:hypothetical protein
MKHRVNDAPDDSSSYSNRHDQGLNGSVLRYGKQMEKPGHFYLLLDSVVLKRKT